MIHLEYDAWVNPCFFSSHLLFNMITKEKIDVTLNKKQHSILMIKFLDWRGNEIGKAGYIYSAPKDQLIQIVNSMAEMTVTLSLWQSILNFKNRFWEF